MSKPEFPSEDLKFDIDLTFACLREAASAKAGILTFELILIVFLSLQYLPALARMGNSGLDLRVAHSHKAGYRLLSHLYQDIRMS